MRIGVDYRVASGGRHQIKRGLGRFTQQQVRAVLDADDADDANEYVLLCTARSDVSLIDPGIRSRPNVSVRRFRSASPETMPPDPALLLRQAEEFQDWVYRQGIDLYHAAAPFVPDPPVLVRWDACPMVANFYDAIPLVFPDQYLTGWWRERYERMLCLLLDAERMIAISAAAAHDAVTYLGYPRPLIHVAWPIPDPAFRVLAADEVATGVARLRGRGVQLPDRYVLTVSHFHHSKNLPVLLRAYALLDRSVKASLPLVICCHLEPSEVTRVTAMARRFGVADNIVLTGMLSDDELAVLYNAAVLVVHPSRYEGFGLPVAEAMRCGTPVITTTSSSMPEVAGGAAVLVGPDDAERLAEEIAALAAGEADADDRRAALAEQGLANAARFDAAQLGGQTLAAYRGAVTPPAAAPSADPRPRPRIALFAPFPPQPTGIADYSAEVAGGLGAAGYDVEVFVGDGCLPRPGLLHQHRVQHASAFDRRHAQAPFDVAIHEMGRSLYHLFSYEELCRGAPAAPPRIVVLHDLTWSHVLFADAERRADFSGFRRHLAGSDGELAARQFDAIQRTDPSVRHQLLDKFLYDHPMVDRLVVGSAVQVVHLDEAAARLRSWHPDAVVHTVPMGVPDPYEHHPAVQARWVRSTLGIDEGTFVVGTFGVLHALKRLDPCLRGFAALVRDHPDSLLLVVGREAEDGYTEVLQELAEGLGVGDRVRFTGHVGPAGFDRLLTACDAVVNLRMQSAIHLSGVALRAAAAGKPVLLTDLGDWRALPGEPFLRIATGDDEADSLAATLRRLAAGPDERRRLFEAGRRWFERTATVERMAQGYAELIDKVLVASR